MKIELCGEERRRTSHPVPGSQGCSGEKANLAQKEHCDLLEQNAFLLFIGFLEGAKSADQEVVFLKTLTQMRVRSSKEISRNRSRQLIHACL